MRIGLCTGGGDCPGLNAAIRAVVKYAGGKLGHEIIGIRDSFNGLLARPINAKKMELSDVSQTLSRGGTILGTVNYGDPHLNEIQKKKLILDAYHELKLDALIVVGGDGTQTIADGFVKQGMRIVGIPKTIDNDLAATDTSIGFHTAVDTATDSITKLRSTAESHDRIMVIELMGRDAGHLALHAGIAGGADVILIPEIPFNYESMVKKIEHRKSVGKFFSIIVVAEGAFEANAKPIFKEALSKFATQHLGGIGAVVAEKLHDLTGVDTRISVLGHVQRGGSPNPYDRVLASKLAVHAVDLIEKKIFNVVVGVEGGNLVHTSFDKISGITRPLKLDSPYIKTAECLGICLGR